MPAANTTCASTNKGTSANARAPNVTTMPARRRAKELASRRGIAKPNPKRTSTSLDFKAVEALITDFTQGKREVKAAYNGLKVAIKKCQRIQERIEANPSEHDDCYYDDYRPFQAFLKNITTSINALNDEIAEMHHTVDQA